MKSKPVASYKVKKETISLYLISQQWLCLTCTCGEGGYCSHIRETLIQRNTHNVEQSEENIKSYMFIYSSVIKYIILLYDDNLQDENDPQITLMRQDRSPNKDMDYGPTPNGLYPIYIKRWDVLPVSRKNTPQTITFEVHKRHNEMFSQTIKWNRYPNTQWSKISCSCGGKFCAHIDATLIKCESAMIHKSRDIKSRNQILDNTEEGSLTPPFGWISLWQKETEWRQIPKDIKTLNRPILWMPEGADTQWIEKATNAGFGISIQNKPPQDFVSLVLPDPLSEKYKKYTQTIKKQSIWSLWDLETTF